MKNFKGAMTALITPFSDDDRVDEHALEAIAKRQIAQGIDGLVACGTTAETPTLNAAERERVIKTVVAAAQGKVPIVAGTGSNSTKETVKATNAAKAWGINAALVVCPYYNKPTQEGLFQHFKAVHEGAGIPVIAYNVPGRTASDLLPETIGRLVEIGAIAGVKDATANMGRAVHTLDVIAPYNKDQSFAMLSGDDFTILPFAALGGSGVISVVSNIAPGDTSALVKLTQAGDLAAAQPLNQRIVALTRALFWRSNPIPIKAVMSIAGWCSPKMRLPLIDADEPFIDKLRVELNRYRGVSSDAPYQADNVEGRFMS